MRGIVSRLGGGAILALVLMATTALSQAKVEKITRDMIPKKVLDAVKSKFPSPEFHTMTKETVDGKVFYDLEFKYKGRKCEMDVSEDGTIVNVEREIAVKDLPKAVAKALEQKYPKAKFKDVMEAKEVKGRDEVPEGYEVMVEAGGRTFEVSVSPDGKKITEAADENKEKK